MDAGSWVATQEAGNRIQLQKSLLTKLQKDKEK